MQGKERKGKEKKGKITGLKAEMTDPLDGPRIKNIKGYQPATRVEHIDRNKPAKE